jgi:hypothetical protein
MEAWRLNIELWVVRRPESQIRIILMNWIRIPFIVKKWIKIRFKVKTRIRIRIQVKGWIRIRIKVMWIRYPASSS